MEGGRGEGALPKSASQGVESREFGSGSGEPPSPKAARASFVHANIPVAILAFSTNGDALSGLSVRLVFSSAEGSMASKLNASNQPLG